MEDAQAHGNGLVEVEVRRLSPGARIAFWSAVFMLTMQAAVLVWGAATINAKVSDASARLDKISVQVDALRTSFNKEQILNAEFRGEVRSLHRQELLEK